MTITSQSPPPVPRPAQRFGGLLIAGLGTFLAWLAYAGAGRTGLFSLREALLGPPFMVIGLALVLFPGYREERLSRGESLEGLSGTQLLTARWRAVLVLSLLSGVFYAVLLRFGIIAG